MTFGGILTRQFTLLQNLEFFLRLITACVCGGIIGIERTMRLKEAGIRTHIIVCCAAALTMIVSKHGFADLEGAEGVFFRGVKGADPARLAAQVLTGVSFLGAGIIFRNGNTVKGLTTAAGIWATAGIGLALGAGMYVTGLFSTALIAVIQVIMHRYTIGVDSMAVGRLRCVTADSVAFRLALDAYIRKQKMQVLSVKVDINEDGSAKYDLTLRMGQDVTVSDLSGFLDSVGGVRAVSIELGA